MQQTQLYVALATVSVAIKQHAPSTQIAFQGPVLTVSAQAKDCFKFVTLPISPLHAKPDSFVNKISNSACLVIANHALQTISVHITIPSLAKDIVL